MQGEGKCWQALAEVYIISSAPKWTGAKWHASAASFVGVFARVVHRDGPCSLSCLQLTTVDSFLQPTAHYATEQEHWDPCAYSFSFCWQATLMPLIKIFDYSAPVHIFFVHVRRLPWKVRALDSPVRSLLRCRLVLPMRSAAQWWLWRANAEPLHVFVVMCSL